MIPFLVLYVLGAAVTRSFIYNEAAATFDSDGRIPVDKRDFAAFMTLCWPLFAVFVIVFRIAKGTWKL